MEQDVLDARDPGPTVRAFAKSVSSLCLHERQLNTLDSYGYASFNPGWHSRRQRLADRQCQSVHDVGFLSFLVLICSSVRSYWAAEIATTLFVTLLIVGRLLYMRRLMKRIMGSNCETPYLSVAALLIESASLFTIGSLTFLISYALNSSFQNICLSTVGEIQVRFFKFTFLVTIYSSGFLVHCAASHHYESCPRPWTNESQYRSGHILPQDNDDATDEDVFFRCVCGWRSNHA